MSATKCKDCAMWRWCVVAAFITGLLWGVTLGVGMTADRSCKGAPYDFR